jgi:coatomer subunit beta
VADFQEKATESVMLECALTATAISNSASTIKASLGAYVNILSKTSEINIKKIILDKLEIVCKNSNYLEDDMIEDLLKGLSTPGVEVKVKIVDIVMTSLTSKSAELTLKHLEEMKLGVEEVDLVPKILSLLELIAYKFTAAHSSIFHYFFAHIADLEEFTAESTLSLCNIFTLIFRNGSKDIKTAFITLILEHLDRIVSVQLLTIVLNELSVHLKQEKDIELTIARLRAVIGALPLQVKQE